MASQPALSGLRCFLTAALADTQEAIIAQLLAPLSQRRIRLYITQRDLLARTYAPGRRHHSSAVRRAGRLQRVRRGRAVVVRARLQRKEACARGWRVVALSFAQRVYERAWGMGKGSASTQRQEKEQKPGSSSWTCGAGGQRSGGMHTKPIPSAPHSYNNRHMPHCQRMHFNRCRAWDTPAFS